MNGLLVRTTFSVTKDPVVGFAVVAGEVVEVLFGEGKDW